MIHRRFATASAKTDRHKTPKHVVFRHVTRDREADSVPGFFDARFVDTRQVLTRGSLWRGGYVDQSTQIRVRKKQLNRSDDTVERPNLWIVQHSCVQIGKW
ncbi:hypothetical protein M426DRAFT_324296 [Hypoxylon sp. CI-4A]|nr:hypothetical protein M426DRAFT_324296 [Hypoxylon sp. CI-4A]